MDKLYELRDELIKAKLSGIYRFELLKSGKWLDINDLITEIDNLKVCQCPPKDELS